MLHSRWQHYSAGVISKMAANAGGVVRVLARAKRISDSVPAPMHFTQSVVDYLGDGKAHNLDVFAWMESNPTQLIISNAPKSDSEKSITISRPSFCPIHNMSQTQHSELDGVIYERGVDTGSAVFLESADNLILLIRRAKHLRTFPNIWVPAGGHIEQGESVAKAGMRELEEETGLKVTEDMLESPVSQLCLWESSFPPKLTSGLPKRHHIVVYLHCKLKHPHTSDKLLSLLKPDPNEVDAVAWFNREVATGIVAASEEDADESISTDDNDTLRAMQVQQDGSLTPTTVPLSVMFQKSRGEVEDIERVSTGTKWGLKNWLKL